MAASIRRGFTPRSLKSASCRRRMRFSASIDRRGLAVRASKLNKSETRRRAMWARAITPTSCHGSCVRTQSEFLGLRFCGGQGVASIGTRVTGFDARLDSAWAPLCCSLIDPRSTHRWLAYGISLHHLPFARASYVSPRPISLSACQAAKRHADLARPAHGWKLSPSQPIPSRRCRRRNRKARIGILSSRHL